jgi:hypothetical protein
LLKHQQSGVEELACVGVRQQIAVGQLADQCCESPYWPAWLKLNGSQHLHHRRNSYGNYRYNPSLLKADPQSIGLFSVDLFSMIIVY